MIGSNTLSHIHGLETSTAPATVPCGERKEVVLDPNPVEDAAVNVQEVSTSPLTRADTVELLYTQYRNLLMSVACRKFRVPESDAEGLLQEVFVSYLQTGTTIENVRAWLVAAICNASRHYWRTQGRSEQLPEDFVEQSDPGSHALPERFAMEMTVRQAMQYLQPRCRETLWLHYFEGRSASDVARELQTTARYAEKLIHNCLKRVREIYMNITAVTR